MSNQLPQQRLSVPGEVDESEFYQMSDGTETLATHADLEEAVENEEKPHLNEMQRYWVNKPYAFVVIYRNVRDNELRYITVEPRLSQVEGDIVKFFQDKLRTSIDYTSIDVDATPAERSRTVRDETLSLMKRYNLLKNGSLNEPDGIVDYFKDFAVEFLERQADEEAEGGVLSGGDDPLPQNPETGEVQNLDSTQVRRILYYLVRDFIRFDRIDPIKQDVNIEDVSCDGYGSPIFVYHSEYGQQLVTNIQFGTSDLDAFVKTLAQTAGKGISRRQPSVDATLSDGSRAQLTLGTETSDQGTNFTIRQFNDIPFTPVDLLNWRTFDIEQMTYLWLAIEHNKSIVFAGGTASGKTTSLNAMSLFMPSTAKIVSIEDTRELEIPQANWVPRTTRESFQEDDSGTVDEFDLLEDALRQRPDYVIMGEVRGQEGQTLFQMLNTGHTTYTTFHADKPSEVIRRFTTDPINVSPSMFDALDIICVQESIDLDGTRVRRARDMVEVDEYSSTQNQFAMNDAFTWDRKRDAFRQKGKSQILDEIQEENAWSDEEMREQREERRVVLSYLVTNNINTYAGVAATVQGYMSSPDTIMGLIADDNLRARIAGLHKMKTVNIDVDPEKEALIPRPRTPSGVGDELTEVIEESEALLNGYDNTGGEFAETIEEMLGNGSLGETDREYLKQIDDPETAGELPEGVDKELTDSTGVSGVAEDTLELDEELDKLFSETETDSSDQMILTSETLEKINEDTETEAKDTDPEQEDEAAEEDTESIQDLFDEEAEETDTTAETQGQGSTLDDEDKIGGVFEDDDPTEADRNGNGSEAGATFEDDGNLFKTDVNEGDETDTIESGSTVNGEDVTQDAVETETSSSSTQSANTNTPTDETNEADSDFEFEFGNTDLDETTAVDEETVEQTKSSETPPGQDTIQEDTSEQPSVKPDLSEEPSLEEEFLDQTDSSEVKYNDTERDRSEPTIARADINASTEITLEFEEESASTDSTTDTEDDVFTVEGGINTPDSTPEATEQTEEDTSQSDVSEDTTTAKPTLEEEVPKSGDETGEDGVTGDETEEVTEQTEEDTSQSDVSEDTTTAKPTVEAEVPKGGDETGEDGVTGDETREPETNEGHTHDETREAGTNEHQIHGDTGEAEAFELLQQATLGARQLKITIPSVKPTESVASDETKRIGNPDTETGQHMTNEFIQRLRETVNSARPESWALLSASLLSVGLMIQAAAIVFLDQYTIEQGMAAQQYLVTPTRIGDLLVANVAVVVVAVLVTLVVNPVADRDYPWDGYHVGRLLRSVTGVAQLAIISALSVYAIIPSAFGSPQQLEESIYATGSSLQSQLPGFITSIGEVYLQLSPVGYSPLELVAILGAVGLGLLIPLAIQFFRLRSRPRSEAVEGSTGNSHHQPEKDSAPEFSKPR